MCREAGELARAAHAQLATRRGPSPSLREQIRWWLHHDERTYAERLRAFVAEIARREGIAAAEALPAATR